jgi:hypothetical protein
MKNVCVCMLIIMFTPLIGGCTEQRSNDGPTIGWWRDVRIEPGPPGCPPTTIVTIHVPDSVHPTLLAVKRTLQEIDVKMKGVKKILDIASGKVPTSGDSDIGRALKEIDSKISQVGAALDTVSRIELNLEGIDLKLSDVKTAMDVASRKVSISGDLVNIINYLRPKLNVELDPNVCSDNKTKIIFNITNLGEHSVSIGEPQLTLSTECIRDKDATEGILSPDVDYKLQWESDGFYVAPGQTIKRVAHIEIRQAKLKGHPLYYSLCIDAETGPEIVDVLSGLLLDSLETDKLYNLSRASFKFAGEIEPSTFHDSE